VSNSLPPEIVVTDLRDGVRYRLPGRRWGLPALLGAGALVAGLIGIGFMSFWLWAVGSQFFANAGPQGGDWMELLLLVAGTWMLLMMLWLVVRGLSRLIGHSEIELRGDVLRSFECWGRLRWARRRPLSGLIRFDVRDAMVEERPGRVYELPRAAAEYNVITAVWESGSGPASMNLARGYPRDWLVPLARDLARRCRIATDGERDSTPTIEVVEEPLPNASGFVDLREKPDDSRIVVETSGAELRLTLPHRAFGRRQAVLTILDDRLRVEQGKDLATRQEWRRHQLADVRVARIVDSEGPDSFEVHIEPHPGEGKRVRLTLTGEAEARWLATTLRRVLQMADADGSVAAFRERDERPPGCKIVEERLSRGIRLVVPPVGYQHPDVRRYMRIGLGYFAVTVVAGVLLFVMSDSNPFGDALPELIQLLWLVPIVFAIGVVGAIEEVVKRARRHAALTVEGDTLVVQQTNLYGTREREMHRSSVADIRVGHTLEGRVASPRSRQAILDRADPTWELHIHLADGTIVRLLDGYGDTELQWLATVLRRTFHVPATKSECASGSSAS